jgi:hypothetical protein
VYHKLKAAKLIRHLRHNFVNNPTRYHAYSFAFYAVYFPNKANQTEKVFDSEKCASGRDDDKWIRRSNVRPMKRYGGSASLRVKKENATLSCQLSYAIYFKLDISVWMKRVNDPEGFVVNVLLGCS